MTGPQGISAAPGALLPITLGTPLPPYATNLKATASASAQVDALLLIPMISTLRLDNGTLLTSVDSHTRSVSVPGRVAYSYTSTGQLHSRTNPSHAVVQPGGFTVVLG